MDQKRLRRLRISHEHKFVLNCFKKLTFIVFFFFKFNFITIHTYSLFKSNRKFSKVEEIGKK